MQPADGQPSALHNTETANQPCTARRSHHHPHTRWMPVVSFTFQQQGSGYWDLWYPWPFNMWEEDTQNNFPVRYQAWDHNFTYWVRVISTEGMWHSLSIGSQQ